MDSQTAVKIFIPITVGLIMFALGLGLTVSDFMRVLEKPRAVAIGLFSQLVWPLMRSPEKLSVFLDRMSWTSED